MSEKSQGLPPAVQTPLEKDEAPVKDLSSLPSDADDQSDEGRPTTDHDAEGWREIDPVKP